MSSELNSHDAGEYEALLQFMYMAPVGLIEADVHGNILMMNPLSAQLLMPLSVDGGLQNLFDSLESVAPDLRHLCSVFPEQQGTICDGIKLHLNNYADKRGPQVLTLSLMKLDQVRLMAVIADITLQDKRERQLRQNDAWLNAIMTSITDYALISLDQFGRIEAWNESIQRVTGFDDKVIGHSYGIFYPEGAITTAQQSDRLREADENGWSLDEGLRLKADGSQFWASAMIFPLPDRRSDAFSIDDQRIGESAYCLIVRDISDKRDATDNLRKAIYGDHLTGLANRRSFFEAAELELSRRNKMLRPSSLILVDADNFKSINDSNGHPAGDAVLRHLATSMKGMFRQVDVVARIGGEEFAVLLPSVDIKEAIVIAERLRSYLESHPTSYEDREITCTVSVGVATMDEHISQLNELMKRADQALYAAKQSGRNRVNYWGE